MQKYGGISRYFVRLSEQLYQLNQEVRLFSGLSFNAYIQELSKEIWVGKSVERYPKRGQKLIQELNSSFRQGLESYFRPEIVHETYFKSKQKHHSSAKVVVGLYDMIQELYPDLFQPHQVVTQAKKDALHRADHIISISHHTKKDCMEMFGVDESKISVVHLACDQPYTELEDIQLEQKRPFFLYVGDRNGYKNFKAFISAFAKSKELMKEMDIIAFGGGGFTQKELSLIQNLGFKPGQVKYMGGHDRVLGKLYSQALAFVYPSLYEGFGIPPLEAMSYACPILASNTSCLPEIIGQGGMLIDPLDEEAFLEALEAIWKSESLRTDLIQRGKARLDNFSWRKTAEETLQVYQKLN